jgi:hypothetical protein
MKGLNGAAVLLTLMLVLSACGRGHTAATGTSSSSSRVATTGPTANSHVRVLTGHPLPAPLLKRIAALARGTARSLGDTSPRTAQLYGPDSRYVLVKASSGDLVQKVAREGKGFYLIVLRGHFACDSCRGPAGAKPPRGTIATDVWSPTAGGTDFGLSDRLPPGISRLGKPTVISLAAAHPLAATSGCVSLRWRLRTAVRRGQSVIEAIGLLTRQPRTVGGTPFWRMRLSHAHTLSGRRLPPSFSGWIQATPYPAASASDAPGLWARDGRLVAIVTPSRVARTKLGPLLSTAPRVGTKVILSAASCWADKSLSAARFTGPLREIPGSNAYALAKRAGGFGAFPLRRFLRLLHS